VKVDELLNSTQDTITVKRVFAEPYEKEGVTIFPTAAIAGGGGGGGGHDQRGDEGEGGGFGVAARPAGVYIVKSGNVRWLPAVDVNRLAMTIGAVAIVYLWTRSRIVRTKAKARAQAHEG
jgi:uncharacterized spore protein YtfJ